MALGPVFSYLDDSFRVSKRRYPIVCASICCRPVRQDRRELLPQHVIILPRRTLAGRYCRRRVPLYGLWIILRLIQLIAVLLYA